MSANCFNAGILNNLVIRKISHIFPFLKKLRRFILALWDSILPTKRTYAQSGEDVIVMEQLPQLSSSECIYIEVGANQPTQISNTYLFYRKGFRGIVMEPNHELSGLFKRFRPEDIHLEIGCSDISGVGEFKISNASVVSGFSENIKPISGKREWIPLLTVDEIWRDTGNGKLVFIMSIDTEGFDLKVLKGAAETLLKTLCVVIETSEDDRQQVQAILHQSGFKLIKTTHNNHIWLNEKLNKAIQ